MGGTTTAGGATGERQGQLVCVVTDSMELSKLQGPFATSCTVTGLVWAGLFNQA
jgi:hypothetical protein